MVDIINGKLQFNELNKDSSGGTEMIARQLASRINKDLMDGVQIIHSRPRELKSDLKKILVCHDLAGDPEILHLQNESGRSRYDHIVFVSHWQFQQYNNFLKVPFKNTSILKNAIDPIEDHAKPNNIKEQINLIYHTTPHRGLELLFPVFEHLAKEFPNIHLDVYSSFEIYGWKQRDEPYKQLFENIKAHPQCTYHGFQPNEVVREALKKAHIFAYPSIWQETSCIALMEAMSAGCICVHPDYGALLETSSNFTQMYRWTENLNDHMQVFYEKLKYEIDYIMQYGFSANEDAKYFIDDYHCWDIRVRQWEDLLDSLTNYE